MKAGLSRLHFKELIMKVTAIRGFILNGKKIKPSKKTINMSDKDYAVCKRFVELVAPPPAKDEDKTPPEE